MNMIYAPETADEVEVGEGMMPKCDEPKVLLVSPASRMNNHYRPPLALIYVSGYLKHKGIKTRIIDSVMEDKIIRDRVFIKNQKKLFKEMEDLAIEQIANSNSDIIGITCYTPELEEVEGLAKRIKKLKPNVKLVAGGIHSTLFPGDMLGPDSDFDFVVFGEGEVSLYELVREIRSKNPDYNTLKGIGFYDHEKNEKVVTPRQLLDYDLDSIYYPDYEGVNMEYYTNASPYAIRGVFTRSMYLTASRGCPSACTFCVAPELRQFNFDAGFKRNAGVRLRSPEHLFAEVKELKEKHGIDSFYFIDDLFTLNEDLVYGFCQKMIEGNLNLVWGCSSKVNTVSYESLKIMKEAGCVQIDFGVEKASDREMVRLKKGTKVREVRQVFKNCRELGIRTFCNFLVNTPGEVEEDLEDILNLLEEIKPDITTVNVFTPYPGTEIFEGFGDKFPREDYSLFMQDISLLPQTMPDRFRFAEHDVDVKVWSANVMMKYNKVTSSLAIFLDPKYVKSLLFSKRKCNYIKQLKILFREFIIQKFVRPV